MFCRSVLSPVRVNVFLLVAAAALVSASPAAAAGFADVTFPGLTDIVDGYGATWVDFDNDGDQDICITSATSTLIFKNDGIGNFSESTPALFAAFSNGRGFVWGDYNNDGMIDGYEAVSSGANQLFAGEGDETFSVINGELLNHTGVSTDPRWSDFDGDGDLDLYIPINSETSRDYLLRNEGGDDFYSVPRDSWRNEGWAQGVAWGDYDNDGDPDIYVSNSSGPNRLYRNDGGGSFADVAEGNMSGADNSSGAAWGDYDNDGDLDLYVVNYAAANRLFRNDGDAGFAEVTPLAMADNQTGTGCAWGDYDNDGDLDLYLVNYLEGNVLFVNDGEGDMAAVTPPGLDDTGGGVGCAWGDCDSDGDIDLLLVNDGVMSSCRLFRNDLDSGAGWMHVMLTGTVSNRSAVGARVRVVGRGGVEQIRELGGDAGHMSSNSLPAEFGLGITGVADSLFVTWPSGIVQWVASFNENGVNYVTENPPPAAPSGCSGTFSFCNTVEVTWTDNSDNEVGFHVYRDGELAETLGPNETLYGDGGALDGVLYNYTVYAFNNSGSSSGCATNGRRRSSPPAPDTFFASDTSCAGVYLEWDPVEEADAYRLFRDGVDAGLFDGATTFQFDEAAPGSYHYALIAENECGTSDSLVATGVVLSGPSVPATISASDTSCAGVFVKWASAPAASGYRVFRGGIEIAAVAPSTLFLFDEAAPGTYHYAVVAENSCAVSDSATADGSVLTPPDPPAAVTASDTSCSLVRLDWAASAEADSYLVTRDGTTIARLPAATLYYEDEMGAGSFSYGVSAQNRCGATDPVGADGTVMEGAPEPPSLLTASTDHCDSVVVTWSDESADELGFEVERDEIAVDTVDANTTRWVDTPTDGLHLYAVRAIGLCGQSVGVAGTGRKLAAVGMPEPDGPAPGFVSLTPPITLSWFAEEGADSYTVQIATDSLFAEPFGDSAYATGDTFHIINSIARLQVIYWRVAAIGSCGSSGYGPASSFEAAPQRPLGDTDADYDIDLSDIDRGVDYILGEAAADASDSTASDINGDGLIDVSDIVALVGTLGEEALRRTEGGALYGAQPVAAGRWNVEIVPPEAGAPADACHRALVTVSYPTPVRSLIIFAQYDSKVLQIGAGSFSEVRSGGRSALVWYDSRADGRDPVTATLDLCPAGPGGIDAARVSFGPLLVSVGGDNPVLLGADPEEFDLAPPPAAVVILGRSYPNPFNPRVYIPLEVSTRTDATLIIYDSAGRQVRTVHRGALPSGAHLLVWDGTSDGGRPVGSGAYFYMLITSGAEQVRRMVLLR